MGREAIGRGPALEITLFPCGNPPTVGLLVMHFQRLGALHPWVPCRVATLRCAEGGEE